MDRFALTAAIAPLTDRAFLRITGTDRTRWLNGMVTNSIATLDPGAGCYNFLLNAQGRILGDCTLFRDPDEAAEEFLLETSRDQIATIQQHLDKFIIMDDVELMPIMDDQHALLLFGTEALSVLSALGTSNKQAAPCSPGAQPPPRKAIQLKRTAYAGAPVLLIQTDSFSSPAFEIWSDPATIHSIRAELTAGRVTEISPEMLESLRIAEGIPRFGVDIRERDLPQETAQDARALHFSKGCYLGQEIVERIHSRGAVHRTFTLFTLEGTTPTTFPAPILADSKPVGEITSAAGNIALGYIRREALDRKLTLTYNGGQAITISNEGLAPPTASH